MWCRTVGTGASVLNPDVLAIIGSTGLGRTALRRIVAQRREAGDDWRAIRAHALASGMVPPPAAWVRSVGERADVHGLALVARGDDDYPPLLAAIPDAPIALFVSGRRETLRVESIAVVGARRCSAAALTAAYAFGRDLSLAGLCIVSGLARGVDAAAHRGALESGRPTVAVLGAGHDHVYPAQHRGLAAEIAACGAVVSEYPPGTRPRKQNFPERNRIVSGLARAVVLIEAGERSGSLITARLALEQGRDVLAVPGSPETGRSRGCHRLIQSGAALVEDARDALDWLGIPIPMPIEQAQDASTPDLVRWLSGDVVTAIDALVERSGWPVERVLETLVELELAGFVMPLDGGYIRVRH